MFSILLIDDEPNIIEVLEIIFREEGMEVFKATSGFEALALLKQRKVDLVISDIRMPDISGVDILKEAKQFAPDTIFIMITAFATTETAIEALNHGAFDYLTKPFQIEELRSIVHRALEMKSPKLHEKVGRVEADALQSQKLFQALHRSRLVGKSPQMFEIYRAIGQVAGGDSTVLITGESGTGKELVARAIHEASLRREAPFVSINCGAFPETLLESELFGYMRGAFTGATTNKKGLFEAATGGSIFLDEVTEMTPPMQVKLLRVLQERRLRPLGGTGEVAVNVRVIAATNRNLRSAIQQGLFREDLYYRIAVINIHLPPLRERVEDIGLLAYHFLRLCSEKAGKKLLGISREALLCLEAYHWPGNVRELENTIERAVALETTDNILVGRLPDAVVGNLPPALGKDPFSLPEGQFDLDEFLVKIEKNLICQALGDTGGNQTLAAQRLKLTKPSLRHKIQTLGIDAAQFRRRGA
jgi:two-component system response regulator PilR (NtrC family)